MYIMFVKCIILKSASSKNRTPPLISVPPYALYVIYIYMYTFDNRRRNTVIIRYRGCACVFFIRSETNNVSQIQNNNKK